MNLNILKVLILPLIVSMPTNPVTLNRNQKFLVGMGAVGVGGLAMVYCGSNSGRTTDTALIGVGMVWFSAASVLLQVGGTVSYPYLKKKTTWTVKENAIDDYSKFV